MKENQQLPVAYAETRTEHISCNGSRLRLEELEKKLKREAIEYTQYAESSTAETSEMDNHSGSSSQAEPVTYNEENESENLINKTESVVEDLKKQVDELKSGLEAKTKELSELRNIHLYALEEKAKAQRALEDMQSFASMHKLENTEIHGQKLRTFEETVETLTQNLDNKEKERQRWFNASAEKDQVVDNLKSLLSTAKAKNDELEEKIQQYEQRVQALTVQLAESNVNVYELSSEKQSLMDDKSTDSATIKSGDYDSLKKDMMPAMKQRCEELENELLKKSEQVETLQKTVNEINEKVHGLNKSLSQAEWKTGELTATLIDKDGEIRWLKSALENANAEKNNVGAELELQLQRCAEHMAQLETLVNLREVEKRAEQLEEENRNIKAMMDLHYRSARYEYAAQVYRDPNQQSLNIVSEDYDQLSSELFKTHKRKYSLEKKLAEMETELSSYQMAHAKFSEERKQMEELLREAGIGKNGKQFTDNTDLEAELNDTRAMLTENLGKVNWYRAEVDYFRRELANRDERIGWLEHELNEVHKLVNELRNAHSPNQKWKAEADYLNHEIHILKIHLREEEDKRKWFQGEKDHFKREYELCLKKCDDLQYFRNSFSKELLRDSFWVNKDPQCGRDRWVLCKWNTIAENTARRVLFEIYEPEADCILLCLSSFNWECALLMRRGEDGTWYVWVDLPTGRHEFRFIKMPVWFTSSKYARCTNDYGEENNWMLVS